MAKPIEIRVGSKLIWKDGAPGPAYAELRCEAWESGPDEGRLATYRGSAEPVPVPACEVLSGVPLLVYGLSIYHPVDDAMGLWIDIARQAADGWRVVLSDHNDDSLVGSVNPWIDDGAGGYAPAALAKITIGSDGTVRVFVRRVELVGGVQIVTGPAEEALSFDPSDISAALNVDLAGMYPAGFDTFGGEGPPPEPEPETGFWTGFRKCHEA